ncbi:cilia- and flagella-associated protein 90 isoform X2 [Acipenser ruthenus]|uniref:cilia- and flagella-associated protein 90 isoform X2 n=1 Tax=Acipenser ruthenus TaxID=7906 RepID=UPI00145BC121|nr:cilia- and flagella-associated protein 90 isoform X2 [Acipenser ruthenus]
MEPFLFLLCLHLATFLQKEVIRRSLPISIAKPRPDGYNQKLHRDDREHAKSRGLNLNNEEISRPVPVLSSSEYGRHLSNAVDKPGRKCVRVGLVRSEFYRRNGFGHSVEEGYGSVTPA